MSAHKTTRSQFLKGTAAALTAGLSILGGNRAEAKTKEVNASETNQTAGLFSLNVDPRAVPITVEPRIRDI
jgi:hypothetical protein